MGSVGRVDVSRKQFPGTVEEAVDKGNTCLTPDLSCYIMLA